MTRAELVAFIRQEKWAVQASASDDGAPQAAVIGVIVTDDLELFFDTLETSRKCQNLRRDPRVAFVIGWDEAQTVQYEGVADEPRGAELEALLERYFQRFPDGRERASMPGLSYFRVRPTWLRFSDFRDKEPSITEFCGGDLAR